MKKIIFAFLFVTTMNAFAATFVYLPKMNRCVNATSYEAFSAIAECQPCIRLYLTRLPADMQPAMGLNRMSDSEVIAKKSGECADLRNANFKKVNLAGVNFKGAELTGANFSSANISEADFTGARLTDAQFFDNIGLTDDLRNVLIDAGANVR